MFYYMLDKYVCSRFLWKKIKTIWLNPIYWRTSRNLKEFTNSKYSVLEVYKDDYWWT